jgi:hypothetical protein
MTVIRFPVGHGDHTSEGDKCLTCKIFALITRDFPNIERGSPARTRRVLGNGRLRHSKN